MSLMLLCTFVACGMSEEYNVNLFVATGKTQMYSTG